MNLYILSYNNYYNRIVKKENSLEDYIPYIVYGPIQNVNFVPNDGVNTEQDIGSLMSLYGGNGDYIVITNENNDILSRWFIIDHTRTRNGQWRAQLRRDLLADFYDEIINAPAFIEKATLSFDDPLIFNNENMGLNQIKTNETLLKDMSGCPWLVGYYDRTVSDFQGTVPINISTDLPTVTIGTGSLETWEYYKYSNLISSEQKEKFYGPDLSGSYNFVGSHLSASGSTVYKDGYSVNVFNNAVDSSNEFINVVSVIGSSLSATKVSVWTINDAFSSRTVELNITPYTNSHSQFEVSSFLYYDGKYVKDPSNGKIYLCKINVTQEERILKIESGNLYNNLNTILRPVFKSFSPDNNSYRLKVTNNSYSLTLTEQISEEVTFNLSGSKLITETTPWNIFAIPYGKVVVKNLNNETIVTTDENISIATAMAMQRQFPGVIHDIQLLPYCPVQELITNNGEITITSNLQYSLIAKPDNEIFGIIFNIANSKFSFDLTQYPVEKSNINIEKKLNNECDKWRLTSPNYSNYFDFSVEKNNGIEFFNIDCEYKPFTPYIHINPNFAGLYGYDDNSPRGLVLGGDFSLTQVIDQWEQYQTQNKNFQNIFDRQIQNMEVNNSIARTQESWQIPLGTIQGSASGALAGATMGGGYGALAGGILGGVTSLAGGIVDSVLNERLRNEAMDYTKDLFGYQLGNIQALPQTISKVSAFNNNNKIFPVLEYYTCTDREKEALLNKLAYNGMTVMAIGKIIDYIDNSWSYNNIESKNYIKGQLIRLDSIDDDFHVVNSIAGELNKGAYFE